MSHLAGAGWKRRGALALAGVLAAACASVPRYPVEAELGFEPLRTTVDSKLAVRYLRKLGGGAEAAADGRIAALEKKYDARPVTAESLRALSRDASVDFAAAYFARRTLETERHLRAQRRFARALARLRAMDRPRLEGVDPARYTLVFVPGLYYRSNPRNGAAMEGPRRRFREMGFETQLVPIDEVGTVEENARVVADHLLGLRASGRRVLVFSSSKGGADVAHALGALLAGRDLRFVAGWLSIGGILHGSPRADRALRWPNFLAVGATGWISGGTLALARDLCTKTSIRRTSAYAFPAHLKILHFVSTPFSGTVSPTARSAYETMRRLGPNDGVSLLPHQMLPEGHAVLAIGLDHYFRDPEAELRALAITQVLFDLIEDEAAGAEAGG